MADDHIVSLQRLIEKKTKEIYESKLELERSHRFLEEVHRTMPGALVVFNESEKILSASAATEKLLGYEPEELVGSTIDSLLGNEPALRPERWDHDQGSVFRAEVTFQSKRGEEIPVWVSASAGPRIGDQPSWYMIIGQDLRERRQLELQLRHTQKLESIGQLAAGVAHEINTPIQFVRDSIDFLRESFDDLVEVTRSHSDVLHSACAKNAAAIEKVTRAEEAADFEFLLEEMPAALKRCMDGLSRVGNIVHALKSFSHPGTVHCALSDLNAAIRDTLVIAASEYKFVAELETELDPELPEVECRISDINQVVLNLVVNAAHAIKSASEHSGDSTLGRIRIATRRQGDNAEIRVQDSGPGIPEDIQHRIFDPFFTTKDVGEGTGQGLALAHKVMAQHSGEVRFETSPEHGTTFILDLPIAAAPRP